MNFDIVSEKPYYLLQLLLKYNTQRMRLLWTALSWIRFFKREPLFIVKSTVIEFDLSLRVFLWLK